MDTSQHNPDVDRPVSGFAVRLRSLQLTALAVTAGLIAAIIVAFALVSATGLFGSALFPASAWVERFVDAMSAAILVAMSAAVVASLYRWARDCPSGRWSSISPGTVLTAVVWFFLSMAFSAYAANIGRFGAAYGWLGAIVALLTWLYFSSLALFVGASLNRAIKENTGAAVLEDETAYTRVRRPSRLIQWDHSDPERP